jgi:hypothetical protein
VKVLGSEGIEIEPVRGVVKEDIVAKGDLAAVPAGARTPSC